MKQAFAIGAAAAILALGTVQSRADQTNLVQTLDIELSGMGPGQAVTNGGIAMAMPQMTPLGTSRVIAALGAATGKTFSKTARITVTTPLPAGSPTFAVTDGKLLVDVTGFFTDQQIGDAVENWQLNLRTGRGWSTTYSLCEFALKDSTGYPSLTLHFDVTGLAVESLSGPAVLGTGDGLSATVTGAGDFNGSAVILQGTIALRGGTLVVVPSGNSPGV